MQAMITGAHVILNSKNANADRDLLRDILGFTHVDVGGGWLIFALPPAELAVHPSTENDKHQLYLMCDDVHRMIAELADNGVGCSPVHEERWGSLTSISLPGGGRLGLYQPKHASPTPMTPVKKPVKKPAKRPLKKPAKKAAKKAPAKPTRDRSATTKRR